MISDGSQRVYRGNSDSCNLCLRQSIDWYCTKEPTWSFIYNSTMEGFTAKIIIAVGILAVLPALFSAVVESGARIIDGPAMSDVVLPTPVSLLRYLCVS